MMRDKGLRWCLVVGCCLLSLLFLSSTIEVSGAPASSSSPGLASQPVRSQSVRYAAKLPQAKAAVVVPEEAREGEAEQLVTASAARPDAAAGSAEASDASLSATMTSAPDLSTSGTAPSTGGSEVWRSPVDFFSSPSKPAALAARAAVAAAAKLPASGAQAGQATVGAVSVAGPAAPLPPALKLDAHLPPSVVPRHVFVNWHSASLPKGMRAALERMKAGNPAFHFRFFTGEDMRNYIAAYAPPPVLVAFDTLLPQAYKADLFRYFALYREGGMW